MGVLTERINLFIKAKVYFRSDGEVPEGFPKYLGSRGGRYYNSKEKFTAFSIVGNALEERKNKIQNLLETLPKEDVELFQKVHVINNTNILDYMINNLGYKEDNFSPSVKKLIDKSDAIFITSQQEIYIASDANDKTILHEVGHAVYNFLPKNEKRQMDEEKFSDDYSSRRYNEQINR